MPMGDYSKPTAFIDHAISPALTKFLAKEGMHSMSFNPDSVMKITLKIIELDDGREVRAGVLSGALRDA